MTTIRPLDESDHEDWLSLWRGYQRFYRVDIDATTTRETWRRLLDPSEPMAGGIATVDGGSPGLVHYLWHRSTWTIGDYCYLQDLYVQPDFRDRGLGRALIAHVCGVAAARGCSRVYWLTHETNAAAMRLYDQVAERSGFVQYRKPLSLLPDANPATE